MFPNNQNNNPNNNPNNNQNNNVFPYWSLPMGQLWPPVYMSNHFNHDKLMLYNEMKKPSYAMQSFEKKESKIEEAKQQARKDFLDSKKIDVDDKIKKLEEKKDEDFKKVEDEVKDTQKKAKELKTVKGIFEDGNEDKTGIVNILSQLISGMDKKGNIDIEQYRAIKNKTKKYIKSIRARVKKKDDEPDSYKYIETKSFYRKMIQELKKSIGGENMDSSQIKEKINISRKHALDYHNKIGTLRKLIQSIIDFFRETDIYTATANFNDDAITISRLCDDFDNAETKEEKQQIANEITIVNNRLQKTTTYLYLSGEDKKQIEEINQMVEKLNKYSVNVTDYAFKIMNSIGAEATNKAFRIAENENGRANVKIKKSFFQQKMFNTLTSTYGVKNASIIAKNFINGTKDLANMYGKEKEDAENSLKGCCFEEINKIDKKIKEETRHSKIELDVQGYIINSVKFTKAKSDEYNSAIDKSFAEFNKNLTNYLYVLEQEKNLNEVNRMAYAQNDIDELKTEIDSYIESLKKFSDKVKEDFNIKDNRFEKDKALKEEQEKVKRLQDAVESWIKEDTEDGKDKDDKAQELQKLRGFLEDIENDVENKYKSFYAIDTKIQTLIAKLETKKSSLKIRTPTIKNQGQTLAEKEKENIKITNEQAHIFLNQQNQNMLQTP